MGDIKERNNKKYFFDGVVNIENFDPNLLKIGKKSYKNIDIDYIDYITVKIKSVNPLHLIISKVDGYLEKKNGNKYLVFDFKDKNKEVLKKYTELRDEIKNKIVTINKSLEYCKDFMKIKFDSDDNLPLNKTRKLYDMIIVIRSIFEENGKFYPQIYLYECLYEL